MLLLILLIIILLIYLGEKKNGTDGQNNTIIVEILVPLKHLNKFWIILEIQLINCEVNLTLNWYKEGVTFSNTVKTKAAVFAITETRLYVPVVILSTEDTKKLIEQLKLGLKRTMI